MQPTADQPSITWAPAASVKGDKISFSECGFIGLQDTLTDANGRHFYQNCYIEGSIDFIWGFAQSVYEVVKHILEELTKSTQEYYSTDLIFLKLLFHRDGILGVLPVARNISRFGKWKTKEKGQTHRREPNGLGPLKTKT
ncbi:Pectinesterase, catalytic [Dillenia turbinata]|uniref:pectinesterase n=1 Tax=Dillenia turbinata TaxID=194707 RepID=A0AAN8YZX7_9MAGN